MAKQKEYIHEQNVEVLERRLKELLEYKEQLESNRTPDSLADILKLTANAIWGPEDSYTKECHQKLDDIKAITPGLIAASVYTGKQQSSFPSKNAHYVKVVDDMIEKLQERIEQLSTLEK